MKKAIVIVPALIAAMIFIAVKASNNGAESSQEAAPKGNFDSSMLMRGAPKVKDYEFKWLCYKTQTGSRCDMTAETQGTAGEKFEDATLYINTQTIELAFRGQLLTANASETKVVETRGVRTQSTEISSDSYHGTVDINEDQRIVIAVFDNDNNLVYSVIQPN